MCSICSKSFARYRVRSGSQTAMRRLWNEFEAILKRLIRDSEANSKRLRIGSESAPNPLRNIEIDSFWMTVCTGWQIECCFWCYRGTSEFCRMPSGWMVNGCAFQNGFSEYPIRCVFGAWHCVWIAWIAYYLHGFYAVASILWTSYRVFHALDFLL